jgi:hypothetical protein
VPLEFGRIVPQIAVGIREVLECDPNNKRANETCFCVPILSNKRWGKLVIVSYGVTNKKATIIINYNKV